MSEDEANEHYGVDAGSFTGWTSDDSYIPTSRLKILELVKKNFHMLYQTTQKGQSFGWHTFSHEVMNSIVISLLLWGLGYTAFSGTQIVHSSGHTSDFWMASFSIYAALIYLTNISLLVRVDQITWTLIGYVVLLSLVPFFLLSFLFDLVFPGPNAQQRILFNIGTTLQYYLLFIILGAAVFMIEVCKKMYRIHWKPSLPDYFKQLIKNGQADQPDRFKKEILDVFKEKEEEPIKKRKTKKQTTANSAPINRVPLPVAPNAGAQPQPTQTNAAPGTELKRGPSESDYSESSIMDVEKNSGNISTTLKNASSTNEPTNRSMISLNSENGIQLNLKPRLVITSPKNEMSKKPDISADHETFKGHSEFEQQYQTETDQTRNDKLRLRESLARFENSRDDSKEFEENCKPHIPEPFKDEVYQHQDHVDMDIEQHPVVKVNNYLNGQNSSPENSSSPRHHSDRRPIHFVPEVDKPLEERDGLGSDS